MFSFSSIFPIGTIPTHCLSESLVTEYPPGAGIGWHRDSPSFGIVAGISFGADCRMRFRRGKGEGRQTCAIDLPPRSLYVMRGAAREEWQHNTGQRSPLVDHVSNPESPWMLKAFDNPKPNESCMVDLSTLANQLDSKKATSRAIIETPKASPVEATPL
jgi:hypothetical protein